MSALYDNALVQLGARQAQWMAARDRLSSVLGPDLLNHHGVSVVQMIESENHLSRAPAAADASLFAEALQSLADEPWPVTAREVRDCYEGCLARFHGRAPTIERAPTQVFRYLNGPHLFDDIEAALSELAEDATSDPELNDLASQLRQQLREAADATTDETWGNVAQLVTSVIWPHLPLGRIHLSRKPRAMFVTFEGASKADRASAARMHSALALWKPLQRCFIQITYAVRHGDEFRYPTFAEAGWFRYFRSAPVSEPHGWTVPHDPADPPQPEAVTRAISLDRVTSAGLSVLRA